MIYVLFVFVFPFNSSKGLFYVLSFLLGLIIDVFQGTGGIHAAATLTIAALRYPLMGRLIGKDNAFIDVDIFFFRNYLLLIYLIILIFTHHFIVYYLDFFKITAFGLALFNALKIGFFTFVLSFITIKFFALNK